MCYPIIGVVISALAAAGSAYQQADQQSRQVKYRDKVTRATEVNAAKASDADSAAAIERIVQVRQAAAQEAYEASRQSEMARGALTAGATAAGLSGGVIGDLRATLAIQAADNVALRQRQASWEEQQIMRSLVGIQAQHQSRLNATMSGPIAGVDYGQLIGSLGQSTVQGFQPGAWSWMGAVTTPGKV